MLKPLRGVSLPPSRSPIAIGGLFTIVCYRVGSEISILDAGALFDIL
jgi:hypothetical protein